MVVEFCSKHGCRAKFRMLLQNFRAVFEAMICSLVLSWKRETCHSRLIHCCSMSAAANTSLAISFDRRAWSLFTTLTYLQQCEGNMWTTSEQCHARIKQTWIANRVAQGYHSWDDARWDDKYKKQEEISKPATWNEQFATILQHQTINGGSGDHTVFWCKLDANQAAWGHEQTCPRAKQKVQSNGRSWISMSKHRIALATWSQNVVSTSNFCYSFGEDLWYIRHSTGNCIINPRLSSMMRQMSHPSDGYPPACAPSISTRWHTKARKTRCQYESNQRMKLAWHIVNPRCLRTCIEDAPICQLFAPDLVYWWCYGEPCHARPSLAAMMIRAAICVQCINESSKHQWEHSMIDKRLFANAINFITIIVIDSREGVHGRCRALHGRRQALHTTLRTLRSWATSDTCVISSELIFPKEIPSNPKPQLQNQNQLPYKFIIMMMKTPEQHDDELVNSGSGKLQHDSLLDQPANGSSCGCTHEILEA